MTAAVARLDRLVAAQIAHAAVLDARERVLASRVEHADIARSLRRPCAVRSWSHVGPLVVTIADVEGRSAWAQLRLLFAVEADIELVRHWVALSSASRAKAVDVARRYPPRRTNGRTPPAWVHALLATAAGQGGAA